jgi:hypothetical protein
MLKSSGLTNRQGKSTYTARWLCWRRGSGSGSIYTGRWQFPPSSTTPGKPPPLTGGGRPRRRSSQISAWRIYRSIGHMGKRRPPPHPSQRELIELRFIDRLSKSGDRRKGWRCPTKLAVRASLAHCARSTQTSNRMPRSRCPKGEPASPRPWRLPTIERFGGKLRDLENGARMPQRLPDPGSPAIVSKGGGSKNVRHAG